MENPKIALLTTFADNQWGAFAEQMVQSVCQHWPADISFWIQLDNEERDAGLLDKLITMYRSKYPERGMDGATRDWDAEYCAWKRRNESKQWGKDYRKQYYRFGHKVFAIAKAAEEAAGAGYEYLIWMDADVITKKSVPWDAIKVWLPEGDQMISYLGRKDWPHSETGFLVFKLNSVGLTFIKDDWLGYYTGDDLLKEEQWHDAWAFDLARSSRFDLYRNLSEGVVGRDVFEASPLGEYMEHYKGPRKAELLPQAQAASPVVDINNLRITTRNCVDHEVIRANIIANINQLPPERWVRQVKPHNEEVAIVSAGPSLSVDEVLPLYKHGVKIVAVKHAMNTLLNAGIIPWACVLLDPRKHVSGFVEDPHPDVNYIVSSMVDPDVMAHLLKRRCNVYGYHAWVGAGEDKLIPKGHMIIQGGSATATRGIGLMDFLGFRHMHLFAYDCCYFEKPDLNAANDKGKPKFLEITLSVQTWGGAKVSRTFWTEGQFLAQVDEMKKHYLQIPEYILHTYGDGIIPWMNRHEQKFKAWQSSVRQSLAEKENAGSALAEVIVSPPAIAQNFIEGWRLAT